MTQMQYITGLLKEREETDSISRTAEITQQIIMFCRRLLKDLDECDRTIEKGPLVPSIIDGYSECGRDDHYTCWEDSKIGPDGEPVPGLFVLHEYYFRGEYSSGEYFIPEYVVNDVSRLPEYYVSQRRRVRELTGEKITEHLEAAAELLRGVPDFDDLPELIIDYLRNNF